MVHPYPCIGFIASTILLQNRAASSALSRITRINTDAGDGVAYLLLPRLTLCLFSTRTLPAGCADPPDASLVCACAPIANVSVIATTSAVRISAAPPCYYGEVARLTVNRR
jgi:hypothetical protein